MDRRLVFATVLVMAVAALTACKSSGIAPNPPTGLRASHVVVGDVGNNAVVTFPATASGTVAPTYDNTSGSIDEPYDIFVDKAAGTVWVSNYHSGSSGTITEYALTATGAASPSVTIGPGGSTTLVGPTGIYVKSDGSIVVADYSAGRIDFFAAGASGTGVAPTKQITGLGEPESLWLDASGNIWVANDGTSSLLEFASTASGAATPIASITSVDDPDGLFVDGHGNIWATNCVSPATSSIEEFAPGSTGAATPTRDIVGSNTNQDCPYGVIVDSAGYIYEADVSTKSVNVFAPGANGNATPVQIIPANGTTGLSEPAGIGLY